MDLRGYYNFIGDPFFGKKKTKKDLIIDHHQRCRDRKLAPSRGRK